MRYCPECANELTMKECDHDGLIPYCPVCKQFHFPMFNSAVSTVMLNPSKDKLLLIQQYGKTANILVAGYINKGENANQALIREVKEEVALNVINYEYNDNIYFEKSNTLIHNFISIVDREDFTLTDEVDKAQWFSIEDAICEVKPNSLAKNFLFKALHKLKLSEKLFIIEAERIYLNDSEDHMVAEVNFPFIDGCYVINHTFVDPSLRGLGIAGKLIHAVYEVMKANNSKVKPTCSYAIKYFEKHPEQQDIIAK
ncbi:MAG: GNAT family N-acetyltransferase [Erysipelotrichia bacterium]|nr:GNAT family N-acetyltransferase [Erysipelotrichia bacterium]NCC55231.1 GNAT family N-acetyltransferase [Erysipelotrichia bacterium]